MINLRIYLALFFVLLGASFAEAEQNDTIPPVPTPFISYVSRTEKGTDTLQVELGTTIENEEAPLNVTCHVGVPDSINWSYTAEWVVCDIDVSKTSPIYQRILQKPDSTTTFTFTKKARYQINYNILFERSDTTYEISGIAGDTVIHVKYRQYKFETEDFPSTLVTIKESALTCPNAFSPNDDETNDYLRIKCQSIVSLKVGIFNRWGRLVAKTTLEEAQNHPHSENGKLVVWDGKIAGRPAKDGVYYLNLYAEGGDGQVYKEKKAISVMKGYKASEETDGSDTTAP